jgi:hypothetical protein
MEAWRGQLIVLGCPVVRNVGPRIASNSQATGAWRDQPLGSGEAGAGVGRGDPLGPPPQFGPASIRSKDEARAAAVDRNRLPLKNARRVVRRTARPARGDGSD